DDLREMNCGRWEGQEFLKVREQDAENFLRWVEDPEFPCPDGESHGDVRRRMERALRAIEEKSNGASNQSSNRSGPLRPIIVSHGTAIRLVTTSLLGVDISVARSFAQDNAAINIFVRRGERWVMKVFNDATHCAEG